jgi:CheY-like chemotaxis protein
VTVTDASHRIARARSRSPQDDFPLNLRLLSRLLQLRGFDVTAVADGGAALNALLASFGATEAAAAAAGSEVGPQPSPPQPFDLALLDMEMPVLSGPQATAAFRQWEERARPGAMRLPLVALTANVHEQASETCQCLSISPGQCLSLSLRTRHVCFGHRSMPPSVPTRAWCVFSRACYGCDAIWRC